MSPALISAVLGVILIAMLLRAVFGFGDAMFAIPLLAALIGLERGAPVLALAGTAIALLLVRERPSAIETWTVARLLLGAVAGVPLGLYVLVALPPVWAHRGLAVLLLGFGAWRLLSPAGRIAPEPAVTAERAGAHAWIRDLGFGLVTGASSAAFDIAGPPLLAYAALRGWSSETLRINFQALFLPLGLVTIAGHGLAGLWTHEVLMLAAFALPMMLLGYGLGPRVRARIQARFGEHAGQRVLLAAILGLGVFELVTNL
ncbi:sulfite exporter TauE/SafE family protein [Enhygromyxa salina]|uniref:Probable membrane transporter protein n=1 Tax=Enhygromyxa salina TaxID=215803 RepID=A0A2S9YSI2_9BACT|nr:sulfite exporter TauE/SafE family protein [Enhygromyxa salina]PRQ08054.1 Sulfite exporter TauE/SafE [Enhygromyxa salina]